MHILLMGCENCTIAHYRSKLLIIYQNPLRIKCSLQREVATSGTSRYGEHFSTFVLFSASMANSSPVFFIALQVKGLHILSGVAHCILTIFRKKTSMECCLAALRPVVAARGSERRNAASGWQKRIPDAAVRLSVLPRIPGWGCWQCHI